MTQMPSASTRPKGFNTHAQKPQLDKKGHITRTQVQVHLPILHEQVLHFLPPGLPRTSGLGRECAPPLARTSGRVITVRLLQVTGQCELGSWLMDATQQVRQHILASWGVFQDVWLIRGPGHVQCHFLRYLGKSRTFDPQLSDKSQGGNIVRPDHESHTPRMPKGFPQP